VNMASERSCSVTMCDPRVLSQCHRFVIMVSGAGVTRLTYVLRAVDAAVYECMGCKIEVQETVNKVFNFRQAIFAPPSKWRPWHMPCLPYPRYATAY